MTGGAWENRVVECGVVYELYKVEKERIRKKEKRREGQGNGRELVCR